MKIAINITAGVDPSDVREELVVWLDAALDGELNSIDTMDYSVVVEEYDNYCECLSDANEMSDEYLFGPQ